MKTNITLEKSAEQAAIINIINTYLELLDADYLEECLRQMRDTQTRRDSLAVLFPTPMTFEATQTLSAAKIRQLDLFVKLVRNISIIREANNGLRNSEGISEQFRQLLAVV